MDEILNLDLRSVKAYFEDDVRTLISNFSFNVKQNETVGIIGESGSGKTISMLAILNQLPKNLVFDGDVKFLGENIKNHRKEICYIPQSSLDSLNPSLTIKKHFKLYLPNLSKDQFNKEVSERLHRVSLDESILNKYPFEISGGMAQKVILALLINKEIKLVIADEITSGLDESSKKEYLNLFNSIFSKAAKIIITHELSLIDMMDKIYILKDGKVLEGIKNYNLKTSLKHPYSKALFDSEDFSNFKLRLINLKKGYCPFYQYCPKATQECEKYMKINQTKDHRWRCNHVRD